MDVLKVIPKTRPVYEAIQWLGSNQSEIFEYFGKSKIGLSPFDKSQLSMRGGDSYLIINLFDWILQDEHNDLYIVSEESFNEFYKIMEDDKNEKDKRG